jgi:hypothetical protein
VVTQRQGRSEDVNDEHEEQLRAFQDLPKPASHSLIDFERAEVWSLATPAVLGFPPQFGLGVTGITPFLDMEVELVPLVFTRQPEYWGIEVVGRLRGGGEIGAAAVEPYAVSIPLSGITGTKGVEVIGATRSEKIEVPSE